MIEVSSEFKNILNSDERNIVNTIQLFRKEDMNNPVDISERIEQININHSEDSSNTTCELTIDNHDGIYTPKNRESSINIFKGHYSPLLDPCNVLKVYTNFENLGESTSYTISKSKNWDIANMEEAEELSNTIITQDGLTLSYSLGSEMCEVSNTDESYGTSTHRIGENYDGVFSGYEVIQNFKFTTSNEKFPSKFKIKLNRPDPALNNDENAKIFCELIEGDTESDFAQHINIGESTENKSPNMDSLWKTGISAANLSNTPEYVTFECDYSGALQTDTRYGLYIYSNLCNTTGEWEYFNVVANDGIYTTEELWNHEYNSAYNKWYKETWDVIFEVWHREYNYQSNGYAIFETDCGENISSFDEVNYTSNEKGTLSFEYSSSSDGQNWSSWHSTLANVPVQRYFRARVTLDNGGDSSNNPYIMKITLNYSISGSHTDVAMFTGALGDEIDTQTIPGKIILTCRDMSKFLQDIFIPLSKSYDSTNQELWYVEEIIQDLLDEYLKDDSLLSIKRTIQFERKPTYFLIRHFQVRNQNLWQSIQQLADVMTEGIRFDEEGILRYYPRANYITPDLVIDEDLIIREDISVSDANIRNHIIVKVETPDGIVESIKENEDSVKKYGKRYMEVNRSLSSMLTSQEQADKLAEIICEDLSILPAECNIELPFFPIIQLGDIIGINSDKAGLSSDMEVFKVISINHSLSPDSKRTSLTLKTHKRLVDNYDKYPQAPTNLSGGIIERTIQNYPNSGWSGTSKTFSYTKLDWTAPTQNTDTTPISHLRGFNIYRDGDFIGHVPAEINGITGTVTWYIDYKASPGSHDYKITAVNKYGKESEYSNNITVDIPSPVTN